MKVHLERRSFNRAASANPMEKGHTVRMGKLQTACTLKTAVLVGEDGEIALEVRCTAPSDKLLKSSGSVGIAGDCADNP